MGNILQLAMFDQAFAFGSGLCQLVAFNMLWEPWGSMLLPYQQITIGGDNTVSFALYAAFVSGSIADSGYAISTDIPFLLEYDAVVCPTFLSSWGYLANPGATTPSLVDAATLSATICVECLAALPGIGTLCILLGLMGFVFFWLFSTFIERCNGCCCWKGGAITYWITWILIMVMFIMSIVVFTTFAPCGNAIKAYTTAFKLAAPVALPGLNMAVAILVETIFVILFMLLVRMPYTVIEAAAKDQPMGAQGQVAAPVYPTTGTNTA